MLARNDERPAPAPRAPGASRRVRDRLARAAVAARADGLIVEVHPRPEKALSDGHQSLTPAEFGELMRQVRVIAGAIGRAV